MSTLGLRSLAGGLVSRFIQLLLSQSAADLMPEYFFEPLPAARRADILSQVASALKIDNSTVSPSHHAAGILCCSSKHRAAAVACCEPLHAHAVGH